MSVQRTHTKHAGYSHVASTNSLEVEFNAIRQKREDDILKKTHAIANSNVRKEKLLDQFYDEIADFCLKQIYDNIKKKSKAIKKAIYDGKLYKISSEMILPIKKEYIKFRFRNRTSFRNFLLYKDMESLTQSDYYKIFRRVIKKFDNRYGFALTEYDYYFNIKDQVK
jgi:hypothetical protein